MADSAHHRHHPGTPAAGSRSTRRLRHLIEASSKARSMGEMILKPGEVQDWGDVQLKKD